MKNFKSALVLFTVLLLIICTFSGCSAPSQEYIKANLSIDAWVQSIISYYNIEEK